jgi:CRP-like cAMP-binding protein
VPIYALHRLVRKLESIASLSEDELAAILEVPAMLKELPADQDIVREGDRSTQCCLVVDGFLCRYKSLADGKRQIIGFYVPGDMPDLHSLHLEVMDHDLATIAPSRVALIPHDALRKLTSAHPRIASALWRDTLVDAAIFREWIVNIGSRDGRTRIAHLLCELFLRLQTVGLTKGSSFDLPLTQAEIGDATGLSAVHVNRSLMHLREDGLIKLARTKCWIPDLARLQDAAMFDASYLHLNKEAAIA